MEVRRHVLIAVALATTAVAAPVRTYPLDDRVVITIAIGSDEPTTCVFPSALTALEGANISAKPEEGAQVLLSYQPGAAYFTVRAIKAEATGAANVVLRGRVFALRFVVGEAPDRVVTFVDEPFRPLSQESLRALIERARYSEYFAAQYPALTPAFEHARPNTATKFRDFVATLEEVFRFESENALVCCARLENRGGTPVNYSPTGLGIRVGRDVFFGALSDASGVIPPNATTRVWFVVNGTPHGGRLDLPVTASFALIVSQ